jgi:adenine phosphoribosyltransferase
LSLRKRMISSKLKAVIRDIPDFPKPGILFKDITPIFQDADLCTEVVDAFVGQLKDTEIDVIAGIESRGFLFGLMLANRLGVPFVLIRKVGKLPYKKFQQIYDLEYGSAIIEIHADAFEWGQKVLIHDDLLATGGTVEAATKLIQQLGGEVSGYCFLTTLDFLNGKDKLEPYTKNIISLTNY